MNRRDFIKSGSLVFTGVATGTLGFSFVPDDFYDASPYRNRIPFRKPKRVIREVVPGFLWIDAADFGDYGGWALDTQHAGFMGSSYLLAHGAGRPVEAARLGLNGMRGGRYRLWVRSRDWIPEHSPGKFRLRMDGRQAGPVFGAMGKKGWLWQDGGVHELSGGKLALELEDLSGFFGRCSSILLTRDLDYRPPNELETFKAERERLCGVSDQPTLESAHDVVVVGAGTAGCGAALAAARLGAKTALISDRPVVGGNASVEIGVPIQGAANFHRFARETGIIEEVGRLGKAKGWGNTVQSRAFERLIEGEPNLHLYTDLFLEGVEKEGDSRIRAAVVRHTLTGERMIFPGSQFIDTSGDSWLGYHAGAEYRFGREARAEFDESEAPENPDAITMSGCLRGPAEGFKRCLFYRTSRMRTPQPFDDPGWLYDLPPVDEWRTGRGLSERAALRGTWWLEHPGEVDDLWNPEFARDELIRTNFTWWHFMKNRWEGREQIANYRLDYLPFSVGKRETRRLVGDYMLHQNDCIAAKPFADAIAHTGWNLDVHAADGILSTTGVYDTEIVLPIGRIPYRCLYSKNIENLFMAGRNVSVTHIALGTVRVQGQTCAMGQAVGTAAAIAASHGTTPRGVYRNHLGSLQQTLLKNDQYIPDAVNEDPDDLARKATVRASSSATVFSNPLIDLDSRRSEWFSLDAPRGVVFPWRSGRTLERLSLALRADKRGEVLIRLYGVSEPEAPRLPEAFATQRISLEPGEKDWVDFDIQAIPGHPFVAIVVEGSRNQYWRRDAIDLEGVQRFFGSAGARNFVGDETMAFDVQPREDLGFVEKTECLPGNVINGIARPTFPSPQASIRPPGHRPLPEWAPPHVEPTLNYWQSSAEQSLPQWIEIEMAEPSEVSMVQCVFDTDLDTVLGQSRTFPRECVRAYRVDCEVAGKCKTFAAGRLNLRRFRRHTFVPVRTRRIRLTVEATHGLPQARVFEIRAYAKSKPFVKTA